MAFDLVNRKGAPDATHPAVGPSGRRVGPSGLEPRGPRSAAHDVNVTLELY